MVIGRDNHILRSTFIMLHFLESHDHHVCSLFSDNNHPKSYVYYLVFYSYLQSILLIHSIFQSLGETFHISHLQFLTSPSYQIIRSRLIQYRYLDLILNTQKRAVVIIVVFVQSQISPWSIKFHSYQPRLYKCRFSKVISFSFIFQHRN